jgi:hypothetical protein
MPIAFTTILPGVEYFEQGEHCMVKAAKKAKPSEPPLKPPTTSGGGTDGSKVVVRSQTTSAEDIPAPPKRNEYFPDEVTLYGVKLNSDTDPKKDVAIRHDDLTLRLLAHATGSDGDRPVSLAVVYGYSYEGHCYRLDRSRLFVVDSLGQPANGCGFGDGYTMWRIRARGNVMEVEISHDTAEVLILNANVPGNKSPNTYRNDMMLAHRGGKLNRPGGT